MRETKFRGLKKKKEGSPKTSNKWVYGSLLLVGGFAYIVEISGKKHYVDWGSVGQCTGLKDKNREEIYEGDIIACYDNSGEFVYNREMTIELVYTECWFEEENRDKIEIVGNIYENKDLIN